MMTSQCFNRVLDSEEDTQVLAQQIARQVSAPIQIHLIGDLGAGKTTFTRYFIRALGYEGKVKSPTYTLVEPYKWLSYEIYHFDLYRLSDPEELEYMGIRDYVSSDTICLFEWPRKGLGYIPKPDIEIELSIKGAERFVQIRCLTEKGAIHVE
jgi:tRNA threonylcarbamoyladenosine biosynthesis protein TsaE